MLGTTVSNNSNAVLQTQQMGCSLHFAASVNVLNWKFDMLVVFGKKKGTVVHVSRGIAAMAGHTGSKKKSLL